MKKEKAEEPWGRIIEYSQDSLSREVYEFGWVVTKSDKAPTLPLLVSLSSIVLTHYRKEKRRSKRHRTWIVDPKAPNWNRDQMGEPVDFSKIKAHKVGKIAKFKVAWHQVPTIPDHVEDEIRIRFLDLMSQVQVDRTLTK